MMEAGLPVGEIARRIGRTERAVDLHLVVLGFTGRAPKGCPVPTPKAISVPELVCGREYRIVEPGRGHEVLRGGRARFLGAQAGAGVTHFRFEVQGLWTLTLTDRDFAVWRVEEVA